MHPRYQYMGREQSEVDRGELMYQSNDGLAAAVQGIAGHAEERGAPYCGRNVSSNI